MSKSNEKVMENKAKKKLTIRSILSLLIIFSMIRQFFLGNYENVMLGVLSLILFMIPLLVDRKLNIDIPPVLEGIILLFIFSAEILGEINAFYIKIPIWDTCLHTMNGFLMAAIGFCLVDFFNRSDRFSIQLSPLFLAIVAFCFSMTTAVLWEFFEFGMDMLLGFDMQKDWVIHTINSVMLDPSGGNTPVKIAADNVLVNGKDLNVGGYLDIGLIDTMKDMIVNFIGAVFFSIIGFFYVKSRGKGTFAKKLIPVVRSESTTEESR